ncbi:MAG: four helix bundle protein [Candidatus Kapabacteria bacterium]|nr:four helix bundle protein [Candidatus Kapabacteria bacterium]
MHDPDIIFTDPGQGELQKLSVQFAREARRLALMLIKQSAIERSSIDQLYRSAMSVGANVREAQFAESAKDFLHKLKVAEKELAEFYFWLGALHSEPQLISPDQSETSQELALRTKKLLASIITSMKRKLSS